MDVAAKESLKPKPWELTLAEYGKAFPPIRCLQRYTSEQLANHTASFRLGYRQRQAMGEYYWVTHHGGDLAFPSAKRAKAHGHRAAIQAALAAGKEVFPRALEAHPDLRPAWEQKLDALSRSEPAAV